MPITLEWGGGDNGGLVTWLTAANPHEVGKSKGARWPTWQDARGTRILPVSSSPPTWATNSWSGENPGRRSQQWKRNYRL